MFHQFILTRFNLPLWKQDKNGSRIDRELWLKERLELFENFCLPSVENQSCQDFTWIMLCDENTPVEYRDRIKSYRDKCHQIELIQVEDGYAWDFPRIFSDVVTTILEEKGAEDGDYCLTTYLDNDDSLQKDYVKSVRDVASSLCENTFISFDYGLQYFTELNVATRVKYTNNHFLTLAERVICEEEFCLSNEDGKKSKLSLFPVRTCYGYGSHFLLEQKGIHVHHITNKDNPMWVEVIHRKNVDNDVKMTFDTELIRQCNLLINKFNVNRQLSFRRSIYTIRFVKQLLRRTKEKIINRAWN